MSDGLLITALGCVVRIDVSNLPESDAAEVARIWAGAATAPEDRSQADDFAVAAKAGIPLSQSLTLLSQQVTLAAIEAGRGQLWMLHAAGLADAEGRVVALVGPSGRGKTTAARTLAAHFGYLSDETVGIDPQGNVLPYRKPLSVVETDGWIKAQRPPGELGLGRLPKAPLRLAAIVLLDRRADGPDKAAVKRCDLGDALPELVAQTSYAGDLATPLRTIAGQVAAVGGVRRVVYREAASLRPALASLFHDPGVVQLPEPVVPHDRPAAGHAGIRRGPYLDALSLADPDRVALLQPESDGTTMFRLIDGIGPALWRAATGATSAELARAAEAAYGRPEGVDVATAVEAALIELFRENVLTAEPVPVL